MTSDRHLLSRINVLVVEDHPHSREYLDDALTYHGAAVIAVESTARALEVVAKVTPTIIIIAMSQHDGVWLLRQLREHQQATGRYVPIIALTTGINRPPRADYDVLLTKPCPLDTLCAMILRFTGGEERRAETA